MYYFSISLVIISNIFYSFFQSIIPNNANPAIAMCCMYIAGGLVALIFYIKNNNKFRIKRHHFWTRIALFALVNMLTDLGFLLAFRTGWELGTFNVIANISILIILAVVGIFLYKERLSTMNIFGIIIGIIGLYLLNI
jgi:drug/metabolite transporter (DMT)-like permease